MPRWYAPTIWAVEDAIFHAWKNGNGLGAAVVSVKRLSGQSVTKEHIHQKFIQYSKEAYGGSNKNR